MSTLLPKTTLTKIFLKSTLTVITVSFLSLSMFASALTVAEKIAQQADPLPPSDPGLGATNTAEPNMTIKPNTTSPAKPTATLPTSSITNSSSITSAITSLATPTILGINTATINSAMSTSTPLANTPMTNLAITSSISSVAKPQDNIPKTNSNTVRTGGFGAMEQSILAISIVSLVMLAVVMLNKKRVFKNLS